MTDTLKFNVRVLADALDPDRAVRKVDKIVRRWAYSEGLEIMSMSQPLVPVDVGALKSTGLVEKPVDENGEIVVRIGYGGVAKGKTGEDVDVGYAYIVHEDLDAHHNHGQAKYLELPYLQRKAHSLANLERLLGGVI
jgi:hypothetical protein